MNYGDVEVKTDFINAIEKLRNTPPDYSRERNETKGYSVSLLNTIRGPSPTDFLARYINRGGKTMRRNKFMNKRTRHHIPNRIRKMKTYHHRKINNKTYKHFN